MTALTIWKVRHKAGDHPDYFSYSVRRDNRFPVVFTAEQFETVFPDVNAFSVPEAPFTAILEIKGLLVL